MLRADERYREFREGVRQLRATDLEEKRILIALSEPRAIWYQELNRLLSQGFPGSEIPKTDFRRCGM